MSRSLDRRGFLQHSCLLGGSLLACSIPLDRSANAAPVRIVGLERPKLIVEMGRALHGIGLGVTTGSGFWTTRGVPREPGTSWTGSRSCSFETEIEKTPFDGRA